MTASSVGQTLRTVVPVPSARWANVGAQGGPLEVTEQPVMDAIPLLMVGQMELPTTLVAPIMVGVTLSVVT